MMMKIPNLIAKINEMWGNDDVDADDGGQTRSKREMQALNDFIYERIELIIRQQKKVRGLITLEFDIDDDHKTVFNEDVDDEDVLAFRVAWGAIDDTWEILTFFCISSPVFHEDELDDFNVEALSFFIDVENRHQVLIDYDPLDFLDTWSKVLSTAIFKSGTTMGYQFNLGDEAQLVRNAKDAIGRVKDMYGVD